MHKQKAWMTTNISTEFLLVLDASIGVEGRNFCCLWTTVLLIHKMSLLHK